MKFEIIELVEQWSLSIRRTLAPIGIPRSTFYDWYKPTGETLVEGDPRALHARRSQMGHKQTFGKHPLRSPLYPGDLNRSTQHLLILLDKEVADGDVTDIVHGEAKG